MEYLLLIHSDEKAMQAYTQEETGSVLAAYGAYMKAMADAGVSKGGQRLHPTSTATTVRVKNGKTSVLNGPYAEVKEQLGGFFLIDAPDLDAAISWGGALPGRTVRRDRSAADLANVDDDRSRSGQTAMTGIEKQAAFYRGYLIDDRSLAPLTTALAAIVGLWLLVYLLSAIGGGEPSKPMVEIATQAFSSLLSDRP